MSFLTLMHVMSDEFLVNEMFTAFGALFAISFGWERKFICLDKENTWFTRGMFNFFWSSTLKTKP